MRLKTIIALIGHISIAIIGYFVIYDLSQYWLLLMPGIYITARLSFEISMGANKIVPRNIGAPPPKGSNNGNKIAKNTDNKQAKGMDIIRNKVKERGKNG